jgi:hypothetical protein
MRTVLVAVGVAVVAYGGWLLVSTQEWADVRGVVLWAAVAVLVHDAVLAPVVLALAWVAGRVLRPDRDPRRRTVAAAATVVLVLLGPVSLAAIPVLGRYGAEPGNPTLLGRDYTAGWLAVALVSVVAATVLALSGLLSEEDRGRSSGGPGPRRR